MAEETIRLFIQTHTNHTNMLHDQTLDILLSTPVTPIADPQCSEVKKFLEIQSVILLRTQKVSLIILLTC